MTWGNFSLDSPHNYAKIRCEKRKNKLQRDRDYFVAFQNKLCQNVISVGIFSGELTFVDGEQRGINEEISNMKNEVTRSP